VKKAGGEPKLAARARALEVSPTVAMAAKARALKAKGVKVYDFTVGEPDQPTPRHVAEAGKAAIDAGQTKYAPAAGIPELRAAIVERYRTDFSVSLATEEVVVCVGGKQALALLYQAILDRGSEVVIPIPAWPTFAEAARVAGGVPVFVPLHVKDGYRVSASAVARKIGPKTRAVMVNSPSNPTGAVIEPGELLKLARLARQKGFWLLYDDTYGHLTFANNGQPQALQEVKDAAGGHLVVVGTASKSYCMTGWRVGWIIGPKALADAATALNSHSVQGPATFAQAAAVQALRGPQDEVRRMLAEYLRRRNFIQARIAAIPGVVCPVPDGAFYVFPDVSRCLSRALPDTLALGAKLLEEKAVAIVPGEGFEAPGTFRLSFATAFEDLQEGASRIEAFFAEHAPPRRGAK
jgi:aspartate aminotransferase